MCNPAAIAVGIGLLASSGGALMQRNAQKKAAKTAEQKAKDEAARQRDFKDLSMAEFDKSLEASKPGNPADGSARDAQIAQTLERSGPAIQIGLPQAGAPEWALARQNAMVTTGGSEGVQAGKAASRMGAFADQQFAGGLARGRANLGIGMANSASQRSAAILPMEQQAAMMGGVSPWGDMLQAAGGLATLYGAMGAPAFHRAPVAAGSAQATAARTPGGPRQRLG